MSPRVLSVQTPLLGNRTYGELLRRTLRAHSGIDLHAEWNPTPETLRVPGLRRLLLTRPGSAWLRAHNLDFYAARYELGASLTARALAAKRVRELRPDVLHFHTQGLALTSCDLMRRIPTVVSADMTAVQAAGLGPAASRWTYEPNRHLERRVFRAAAAVVVLSAWAGRSVIADHGIDPARVHVVPAGVDLERFRELDGSQTRDCTPRILFVGGRFSAKGGPLLVEAFRRAFAGGEACALDLVSDEAPDYDDARIRVHRGVRAYSPEWLALYARANVFALPTAHDASPHVVLEAMAAGIPVVATPLAAIPEFVEDGGTGLLTPPGDLPALAAILRRLASDGALRRRLGARARRLANERYDAAANAMRLAHIFRSVVARCAASGNGIAQSGPAAHARDDLSERVSAAAHAGRDARRLDEAARG